MSRLVLCVVCSVFRADAACSLGTCDVWCNRSNRVIYLILESFLWFNPARRAGLVFWGRCLDLTCVPRCCTLCMRLVSKLLDGQCSGLTNLMKVRLRLGLFVMGIVCRSVRVLYGVDYCLQQVVQDVRACMSGFRCFLGCRLVLTLSGGLAEGMRSR